MPSPATSEPKLMPGSATPQGTLRYAARFRGKSAAGHFREIPSGLVLSSIGIGTYLGEPDEATDEAYSGAVVAAVEGGFNVVDTAINYRFQRSERSIGAALKELVSGGFSRDEIVLCTKAGFLTPDGDMPADRQRIFLAGVRRTAGFSERRISRPGCHCMTPRYLADQLERSRRNHGCAMHRRVLSAQSRNAAAARYRKRNSRGGFARHFSFWSRLFHQERSALMGLPPGMRFAKIPKSPGYLSLEEMARIAAEAGGQRPPFSLRAVAAESRHARGSDAPESVGRRQDAGHGAGRTCSGNHARCERFSSARPAHEESARVHAQRLGNAKQFRARAAIRAFRARDYHRAWSA